MAAKILVTGSRDWDEPERVRRELEQALNDLHTADVQLVHGACPSGADQQAEQAWLQLGRSIDTVDRHPADRRFGRRGFYLRNQAMVDLQPDVCLAFIGSCSKPACDRAPHPHPSHGTQMTIGLCEKAGVPVRRFYSRELEQAGRLSTLWLTRHIEQATSDPNDRPRMTGSVTTRPWPGHPERYGAR